MKKTFKALLSFLAVIAVFTSALCLNVSAASVSVGGGEFTVGQSVKISVKFTADANLYAVEVDASYNSSVLRLESVSGADYTSANGSIKIVDDNFSATRPTKNASYTLNFTAIAAGNSNISVSVLGGGEATSKASGTAAVTVITPKPSSNANLSSLKVSGVALSPAFSPNTTTYNATVKYSVESVNISGSVADGGATYAGGGSFNLQVGDNSRTLTVTAADGTKKAYTVNIKRMSEQETADAETAAREANPFLVITDNGDLQIASDLSALALPEGYALATQARKGTDVPVVKDNSGKYTLFWLTDANGENGAYYTCDENGKFTKLLYVMSDSKMYIIEGSTLPELLPSGFIATKCKINDMETDCIGYEKEGLKEFYVLQCYVSGAVAYYRYDSAEGTMQRAVDFDLALSGEATEAPLQDEGILAWFNAMNKTGKIVLITIIATGVLLIVLAVLLIVKIAASNSQYDIEENAFANDGFVLEEFTEAEKQSETVSKD